MPQPMFNIPITLEMNESSVNKLAELVDGEGPVANKIAALTQEIVMAIAKGAMLIPVEYADQIRDISPDLDNPESLLEALGASTGIMGGDMIIKWPTDPAMTEPLRQRAEGNGVTVQQLIKDMLDQAVAMGWFYDLNAHVRTLFVTPTEADEIREILGVKEFNAADVLDALRLAAQIQEQQRATKEAELPADEIIAE